MYTFKCMILEIVKKKSKFTKVSNGLPRRCENDTFESTILESVKIESARASAQSIILQ